MQPTHKVHFALGAGFNVDRAKGTLANLSLITGGREAKGHGLYIDDKTLSTGLAAIQAAGGRLKGAMRHPTLMDLLKTGGDRVLDFPGFFSGISQKGPQLVADQFEFYDSFKADAPTVYNRMLEMADKTPDLFGLSIEAGGYAVFVTEDGAEFGEAPADAKLLYGGLPALRITDLVFAAFVDCPAANDGLFAQLSSLFGGKQKKELAALAKEVSATLGAWAKKHGEELAATPAKNHAAGSGAPNRDPSPENLSTMEIIAQLKTEFGADQKKFAAAMLIVGNKPTATLQEVKAELAQAEATTLADQVTKFTADLKAANEKATTLATDLEKKSGELAALQKRFDTLKASGIDPVLVGTPHMTPKTTSPTEPTGRGRMSAAFNAQLGVN